MSANAHISTITQKGQTTIPVDIRHKLGLEAGDKIAFEIFKGKAIIKKLQPIDAGYHRALKSTLSEWNSSEDNEVFNDL